ncbi:MAG: alpha/beta hydrolase family protein [Tannerellaceae bacterium]
MKRIVITTVLFLLPLFSMLAQSTLLESKKFNSKILNKEVAYSIYLPDDYNTSTRNYPVLYLLHGWSDDETSWVQIGNVKDIADKSIKEGNAVNMIIVMPNAEETWYVNSFDKKERYEDMFFEELIPYIESNYRARAEKQFRAISGLSMGGYGSFLYSLHHPDAFAACAPLSAAVYTDETLSKDKESVRGKLFKKLYGTDINYWHDNSVLFLMENLKEGTQVSTRYYIDCGDDDTLLHGNNIIHEIMQQKGIKHEFRVRDGGHSWTYWRTALPTVLEFISQRFQRS